MNTTMVNYLAKKNNVLSSLSKINSAILSGVTIVIGYTNRNLRYGCMAENYLHIGGQSVYWPIGYASPETVAQELKDHAKNMGFEAHIKFAKTCNERGQMGTIWWKENTNCDKFTITDSL